MGRQHTKVPSPGVAAFIGLAGQIKSVGLVSAGTPALQTLPFGSNPGDATGTNDLLLKYLPTSTQFDYYSCRICEKQVCLVLMVTFNAYQRIFS